jgi:DNA-binding transcriptional regulator YiaG
VSADLHLCELLGLPCECRRPGRPQTQPHGTLAAARRHYRHDGPGWRCRSCRQAEHRAEQDRPARTRVRPAPTAAGLAAGRAIREMRCAAGMTQRALGAALGVSQSTVSAWEQGEYGPGPDLLARVAAATGAREVSRAAA